MTETIAPKRSRRRALGAVAAMFGLAAALAAPAAAFAAEPAAVAPLPVNAPGRVAREADGSLRFGWPGAYFEGRFQGSAIEVALETDSDFMRVLVDGREMAQLRRPGRAWLTLAGLSPGEHVVRLEKQTESQAGGGRFIGFYPLGGKALPPPRRARRIEFIGDSHTVGYGDTSAGRSCPGDLVHDTTDSQKAFGPVLARRLDADYRLVAYSGFGIVRNYNGGSPGLSLPAIYERATPGEAAPARADDWRPQIIVINLGTNDFSTPVRAGEPWADQAALRTAYRDGYLAFVRRLIQRQPQAKFVLVGSDPFYDLVQQVADQLRGEAGVVTTRYGTLALEGCDYHPSLADHEAIAALVERAIAQTPDAWATPKP